MTTAGAGIRSVYQNARRPEHATRIEVGLLTGGADRGGSDLTVSPVSRFQSPVGPVERAARIRVPYAKIGVQPRPVK
jgi:hypothetical protein